MTADVSTVTMFVAVFAATLMGATYATARYAFREWRTTLAKVPVLRGKAVAAMVRAATVVAVTLLLVFAIAAL